MARFNAAFTRIKIMFSRIRGLISCQSNTQTIAPTLSPPSSGHVSFAGVDYPLLPLDHQRRSFFSGLNAIQIDLVKTKFPLSIRRKTLILIILSMLL